MSNSEGGNSVRPINVLLVEDDPGDALLTREALNHDKLRVQLAEVHDGLEALDYLKRKPPFEDVWRPDVILLDLNMPRMDGREFLQEMKTDEQLKAIPVVVLTTSSADEDILRSYELQAACYITKPVDFAQFTKIVENIKQFWFTIVKLPPA